MNAKPMTSADAAPVRRDPVAISPAIGPLPAIYIPQSPGEAPMADLLWHAAARAARLAGGWITRHIITTQSGSTGL